MDKQERSYRKPEIKEYSKKDLRILLANPEINTKDLTAFYQSTPMSERRFRETMEPILQSQQFLKVCSVNTFKSIRIIPAKVVKVIFDFVL